MDEVNEKMSQTLNKKKRLKGRILLISSIIATILVVILSIVFAVNVFKKYKNNGLNQEILEGKEEKEIKVLSEDIVWISTYELKDIKELTDEVRKQYKDKSGLIKGNNIYIKEGMYEFELSGDKYGVIWLKDKSGELKLAANFYVDDGQGGSFTKITEAYLVPGMTLEVKPDQRQATDTNNIRIHIKRLNKDLEQTSVKEGKTYKLTGKSAKEFYRVGEDIPSGMYDIELIEGKSGTVRIHEKEKESQQSFRPSNFQKVFVALHSNEKLFKDISLNNGDRVFLMNTDESTNNTNYSKYNFIAK